MPSRRHDFADPAEAQAILDDGRRKVVALGYDELCARIGPVKTRFFGLIQMGGVNEEVEEIVAPSGRRYVLAWSVDWDDRPSPGGDLRIFFELFEDDHPDAAEMISGEIVSAPRA